MSSCSRRRRGRLTTPNQDLIRAVLIAQLRRVALARLEFDGDLGVVEQIGALEDDSKAPLAAMLLASIVNPHNTTTTTAPNSLKGIRPTQSSCRRGSAPRRRWRTTMCRSLRSRWPWCRPEVCQRKRGRRCDCPSWAFG